MLVPIFVFCCLALCPFAGEAQEQNATTIWDLFSSSFITNCKAWERHPDNPVLGPLGTTWKKRLTASPDIIRFKGKTFLYYRGTGVMPGTDGKDHDRIGVSEVVELGPRIVRFVDLNRGLPAVELGGKGEFDGMHVLEPAAAVYKGELYLYYAGIGDQGERIGLAISGDGERFTKVGAVWEGRAPEVVVRQDSVFLFYQKFNGRGYDIHIAVSTDGRTFHDVQSFPVLSAGKGGWDGLSVVTPKIEYKNEWYLMMYGGSASKADEPEYFGIARSRDLLNWERHPGNPVFGAGARGAPDGGAIWHPCAVDQGDAVVLLYEGSPGDFRWNLEPSICMAWLKR
jgi:predicted GH43/DUF377 family glycosyl hydrolase